MAIAKDEKAARNGLKAVLGLFVYGLTTAVVLGAVGFWWAASQFSAPGPLPAAKTLTIERGSGLRSIAATLHEEGAVENPYIFIFGVRILGAQSDLQAGEYQILRGASAKDIAFQMRDGDTVKRRFTIREGLTSYEVVRMLNAVEGLSGELPDIPPEGSLLPNTYDFQMNEKRQAALFRMQEAMVKTLVALCKINPDILPLSFDMLKSQPCGSAPLKTVGDVLTLASIVEKETGVNDERAKVAGVFINRLKKGMALQTDPTVIYAITKGKHKNDGKGPLGRRLLRKDLSYESPYNTYLNAGLPPGPIANPGKASIEAVLAPQDHSYIYFVADGSGGHVFGKTLAEHNANVAKWRKIRKAQQK